MKWPTENIRMRGRISTKSFFVCPSQSQITHLTCMMEPPKLSSDDWSKDFVDFVDKCLTKEVEERPSAKQLMDVGSARRCDA